MIKIIDLKLAILLEHQNKETFFAKEFVLNWSKKIL